MYSRIERLMWGNMCGVALCSVLSRSNNQTEQCISGAPSRLFDGRQAKLRRFSGSPQMPRWFSLVRLDHRADAVVGQDFQQQRVFDATVDDAHP